MRSIAFSLSFFAVAVSSCAQNKTTDAVLLEEAQKKLKEGTSVSAILTDPKYMQIHPLTEFRDAIKDKATTDVLKVSTTEEPGKKIRVKGMVTNTAGKPVAGALVYLYHTSSAGWYAADRPHVGGNEGDMKHARLFGYVKTDANGRFELQTVKPSGYPQSDLPAHIHVHVWADGYPNYVSEFLFDDDERLIGDIRARSIREQLLISRPEKANKPFDQEFSYQIVLSKQ